MRLVSWNVQSCRGLDGRVDPHRIAEETRRLADPDVVCYQEIASHFPEIPGSRGEDQATALANEFPNYEAEPIWAEDLPGRDGERKRFGNLLLSRLPVGRLLRHLLPWPEEGNVPTLPRAALEAVVDTAFGAVRVMTTQLEYHSPEHRAAQVERLHELHREALAARFPAEAGGFELVTRPKSAILCGDFNMQPDDRQHQHILNMGFVDAWEALHPGIAHPETFKVHQREKDEEAYCCDFIFVTQDLAPRLRTIKVDGENRASDHQPLVLELA
jgi:endonuclease/exonuclease/phosphatase family metal-dependent hydrolase